MLALIAVLLVVIGLLAMDDVRMRMTNEPQQSTNTPQPPQGSEPIKAVSDDQSAAFKGSIARVEIPPSLDTSKLVIPPLPPEDTPSTTE